MAASLRPVRYGCQPFGIRGVARWMKSTGAGGRGFARRAIETSSGSRFPFFMLQGAHEVQMELPVRPRPPAPVLFIRLATPKIPARWEQYLGPYATATAA